MCRNSNKHLASVVVSAIEYFAIKKANSNCLGLLYEPQRPDNFGKNLLKKKNHFIKWD